MGERPILMSSPMVRALLSGTKTQTRRAVKGLVFKPDAIRRVTDEDGFTFSGKFHATRGRAVQVQALGCPYGVPGDTLWVREEFSGPHRYTGEPPRTWPKCENIWFWADGEPRAGDWTKPKPSIHMPRWASRITLRVTDVRVERLRDISEEDAQAEGVFEASLGQVHCIVQGNPSSPPREAIPPLILWELLWKRINGDESWDANPWVWCVSFERVTS